MFDIEKDYNAHIEKLRALIKSVKNFDAAIELALFIHGITHAGKVSSSETPTYCDSLIEGHQRKRPYR